MARSEQLKKNGTLHPHPTKVRTPLLSQSPFFDAEDLVQMKYEMLRSVNTDKQSAAAAARAFGLSRVAYYRAHEQYQVQGVAGLLPRRRGPKQPRKFNAAVMDFIKDQLATVSGAPDWDELRQQIATRFGIKVHPRSVARAVKRKKGAAQ